MIVNRRLRDIECCGVNYEKLVQDIISEVPDCIVMVMSAWILQLYYILIANCVRFLR